MIRVKNYGAKKNNSSQIYIVISALLFTIYTQDYSFLSIYPKQTKLIPIDNERYRLGIVLWRLLDHCFVSCCFNICLTECMQQLQDNAMKYCYWLMRGKVEEET